MKKLLIGLLLLVAGNTFAQNYTNYNTTTTSRKTSTMVLNQYREWDFIDNNDPGYVYVNWRFVISKDAKTGTIVAGSVSYNAVLSEVTTGDDGEQLILFNLTQIPSGRQMDLVVSESNNSVFIGVYDYVARTAYYYY